MLDTLTLKSINPATGDIVGSVPITDPKDIPAQVAKSKLAQGAWGMLSISERRKIMEPFGPALIQQESRLASLITQEMGKPIAEATAEVRRTGASLTKQLAEIEEALESETIDDGRTHSVVYRDPFGVCGVITPWNFPLAMPHSLVLPALLAGNSVVMKPSEETPLVAQAYADIFNQFLPPDVFQVIHGADAQGRSLVESDVDFIAFTGSREVGKLILAGAAPKLKRVVLELGGKDPLIVMNSADLQKAAEFAAANSFRNAGQVCVSTERIYVDKRVKAQFELLLGDLAGTYTTGNGMHEDTKVGPMIHDRQRQHVLDQISQAEAQGARVVAGGTSPDRYISPTVLSDLKHDMDIMKEETFGPVACVISFDNTEQAIEWANNTPFGLGATVFGSEPEAMQIARQLTSGMIGVNQSCGGAAGSPWVGAKESGYGFHSSRDGHRQFAQTRVVSKPTGN